MSLKDIGTPCTWCQGPIAPERARLASHGVNRFCSDRCSRRHANSLISKGQREEWERSPNQICQVPGCGKTFKPSFSSNYKKQIACQDCVGTRVYRRWMSKRSRDRHRADAVNYDTSSIRLARKKRKRKLRPCLSKDKRSFRSSLCDGKIHGSNWWFCDDCDREYKQRPEVQFADLVINIETIHLAESCIL